MKTPDRPKETYSVFKDPSFILALNAYNKKSLPQKFSDVNWIEKILVEMVVLSFFQNFFLTISKTLIAKWKQNFGLVGQLFTKLFNGLWGDQEVRILILGLDGAGKTTILYRLQMGEVVSTIPTIGFNVETVTYKNIKFQVWDLGGQTSIRPYWRCYYANTDAIIYVVDSADRDRIGISRDELVAMLDEEELQNSILLVFANKQDMEGAMSAAEISDSLGLTRLKNRQWAIYRTSALKGEGLTEGLDW
ncbi:hypothetical protein BB558_000176 [Smittium angustum]|uniref:ADP-ribosylation factor-like protein 1 n=2 Tax=Harpellales TaxID=61421 RepID=A0A2U1JF73_SMIAN|nr:hypothetical protein BB558_000176 [Smittium angustum]